MSTNDDRPKLRNVGTLWKNEAGDPEKLNVCLVLLDGVLNYNQHHHKWSTGRSEEITG